MVPAPEPHSHTDGHPDGHTDGHTDGDADSAQIVDLGARDEVFADTDRVVLRVTSADGATGTVLLVLGRHGDVFGMLNRCPHLLRGLEDAKIRGRVVTCPGHGFSFDMCTGARVGTGRCGMLRLRLVRVWTDAGRLLVAIEPNEIRRFQTC